MIKYCDVNVVAVMNTLDMLTTLMPLPEPVNYSYSVDSETSNPPVVTSTVSGVFLVKFIFSSIRSKYALVPFQTCCYKKLVHQML